MWPAVLSVAFPSQELSLVFTLRACLDPIAKAEDPLQSFSILHKFSCQVQFKVTRHPRTESTPQGQLADVSIEGDSYI